MVPKTRKELVMYLWNKGINANVFKEGPYYAIQTGTMIHATGIRALYQCSFEEWLYKCLTAIAIKETYYGS